MALQERIFLGLGANLGDPVEALEEATERLARLLLRPRSSRYYSTAPRYDLDQAPFVNMVLSGESEMDPLDLLRELQRIELDMGRVRDSSRPKGPRMIDIDILLFGDRIILEKELIIPHPRMGERKFVLVPLLELDSTLTDPQSGEPWSRFLGRLKKQGIYYMSVKDYSSSLSWEGLERRAWK